MAKYVGGSEYAQPKVNPIQQGVLSGVQEISKQVQVARVQKLLDDHKASTIQKAMALASLGHEKLGSDLLKQQANQSALQQIQENLRQNLGMGQQAPNPEGRDRSWVPDMSGRTPTIRPNEPVNQVQPGAEPQGTPSQPGFSPNAPAMAARNATALNTQGVPQMGNVPQATPQVMPQQRQISPEQEAAAYEQAAQEAAAIHDKNAYDFYQNKTNEIRKDIRQQKKFDFQSEEKRRAERLPILQQYANEAKSASDVIANQEELLRLVNTGDLDNPLFATLANNVIPYDLAKQFLSPETVTYEAIRAANFAEIRNMFKGTTNLKEIEIEDARLAGTFLNDLQKKAVLNARIKAEGAKLIKAQAAEEIDAKYPNASVLEFQNRTEKLAKKNLEQYAKEYAQEIKRVIGLRPLSNVNQADRELVKKYIVKNNGNLDKAYKQLEDDGYKFE